MAFIRPIRLHLHPAYTSAGRKGPGIIILNINTKPQIPEFIPDSPNFSLHLPGSLLAFGTRDIRADNSESEGPTPDRFGR